MSNFDYDCFNEYNCKSFFEIEESPKIFGNQYNYFKEGDFLYEIELPDLTEKNDEDYIKESNINFNNPLIEDKKNNNKKSSLYTISEKTTKTEKSKNLDNKIRDAKIMIINTILLKFLNYQILRIYNNNIGHNIFAKKLLKISPSEIIINKAKFNIELLNKTLKEIFSFKITKKSQLYSDDHNKKIINELLNEDDDEKRKIFNNLFSKTFLECIQCINGQKILDGLEGLKKFYEQEVKKSKKDIEQFEFILKNYEQIYQDKKPRNIKPKTKK